MEVGFESLGDKFATLGGYIVLLLKSNSTSWFYSIVPKALVLLRNAMFKDGDGSFAIFWTLMNCCNPTIIC